MCFNSILVLTEYYVGVITVVKFSDSMSNVPALKLLRCGNCYGICFELRNMNLNRRCELLRRSSVALPKVGEWLDTGRTIFAASF